MSNKRKSKAIVSGVQRVTVNSKSVYLNNEQANEVVNLIKSFKPTITSIL